MRRRWLWRGLLGPATLVCLVLLAGAVYQWLSTVTAAPLRRPPGEMIAVNDHGLHLRCIGAGTPTVVLEHGHASTSVQWARVQEVLGKVTRVCAYDRAGYGWSETGPDPRTVLRATDELHALLQRADMEPPYVLVGHSLGGAVARLYASRYPERVAGLGLLDPLALDVYDKFPTLYDASLALYQRLRWVAPFGIVRLGNLAGVLPLSDAVDGLPPEAARTALAMLSTARHWRTAFLEWKSLYESAPALRQAQVRRDLPVLVISADRVPGELPAGISEGEFLTVLQSAHAGLAKQSDAGRHLILNEADHFDVGGVTPTYAERVLGELVKLVAESGRRTDGLH